ncbi:hypothetical protein SLS60_009043 [Paraconiothyrium brasiliense]|uniref:Voltage-dependent anion channel n=1 Tax=Paraconiothyrium brasiliense TaxID=300254 RepID=A0ABR3QX96_9PLEO
MTQGTTGGLIVRYSVGITSAEAIPIIVLSYMLIGYALFLAVLYYAMYLHRLLTVGPPQNPKVPALVILIGPCGQFATAIQLLGTAASTRGHFASHDQGTFLTGTAASTLLTTSTLLALMVDGFAFLWITVAWYHVIEALVTRRLSFSLTWWSLIFPMGVFTTSLMNLSIAMNSPGFRGLSAALLIFLLIIYFFNLGFSIYRIVTGVAFGIPQQREEEKKQEQEEREKRKEDRQNGHRAGTMNGANV